jgi:hypothetical protein
MEQLEEKYMEQGNEEHSDVAARLDFVVLVSESLLRELSVVKSESIQHTLATRVRFEQLLRRVNRCLTKDWYWRRYGFNSTPINVVNFAFMRQQAYR